MKKCGGMFDFDRKSGREADREKRDRFVIINSSEGRQRQRHYPVLSLSLSLNVLVIRSNKDNYYDQAFFYYLYTHTMTLFRQASVGKTQILHIFKNNCKGIFAENICR